MTRFAWTMALAALLALPGCRAGEEGAELEPCEDEGPGACECEEELPVERVELSWVLVIEEKADRPASVVTAAAASGLEPARRPGDVETLRLAAGATDELEMWRGWREEIRALGEACSPAPEECLRTWEESGLTGRGVLSLVTGDEETLATWILDELWPAALVAGEGEAGDVLELGLVGRVTDFSFHAGSPRVLELFGDAPVPAILPEPPESRDPEAEEAYEQALRLFAASYHAPEAAIARLNELEALNQYRESNLDFVSRLLEHETNVRVEITGATADGDKTIVGGFQKMSGMDSETEVIELEEGGGHAFTHKLPGRSKSENITLKRGTTDSALYEWYLAVLLGEIDTGALTICLALEDEAATCADAAMQFNFDNAWPSKWSGPSARGHEEEIDIESISFNFGKIE